MVNICEHLVKPMLFSCSKTQINILSDIASRVLTLDAYFTYFAAYVTL